MIKTIVLARHGEFPVSLLTKGLPDDVVISLKPKVHARLGLTDSGIQQAQRMGSTLHSVFTFNKCYVSPYKRAVETAQLAFPHAKLIQDARLGEREIGTRAGERFYIESMPEGVFVMKLNPQAADERRSHPLDWEPTGGESLRHAGERLETFLTEVLDNNAEDTAVVVTHGEIVIAGRSLKLLGNMSAQRLKKGVTKSCPGFYFANCQFDIYTRDNPHDGGISDTFDWMRSIDLSGTLDTGWITIDR